MSWARSLQACGFESHAPTAYLRNAKGCISACGAEEEGRSQLDGVHPQMGGPVVGNRLTATIGSPVQQLDISVGVVQSLSGRIQRARP